MSDLSKNAERALLFQYVLAKGHCPEWAGEGENAARNVFSRISGISPDEAAAAFKWAKSALLFNFVLLEGDVPPWSGEGPSAQMKTFAEISGLSEVEVCAAYAELEDAGMIDRNEPEG